MHDWDQLCDKEHNWVSSKERCWPEAGPERGFD